jgi:microcystin-dependent protein
LADAFVSEIRIFGFNFAPTGWAFCNGQLMLIAQNTALFSLLGVAFGGDGKTTFGLPNLQGAVPVDAGRGPGLSDYQIGQTAGSDTVTLNVGELPTHNHLVMSSSQRQNVTDPTTP